MNRVIQLDTVDLKNNETDSKYIGQKNNKELNKIIGNLFLLKDKAIYIHLINSIYNDNLNIDSEIMLKKINKISKKDNDFSSYKLKIIVEEECRKFKYYIDVKFEDKKNIVIIINKKVMFNNSNLINFHVDNNKNYNKSIIIINWSREAANFYNEDKVNIIENWKYDFRQLYNENKYLLFPFKTLDLSKRLINMSDDLKSKDIIQDEVTRFLKNLNNYLKRARKENLITELNLIEINNITIELLLYFLRDKKDLFDIIDNYIKIT